MSLDFEKESFKALFGKTANILEAWYENTLRNQRIYKNYSPKVIQQKFNEPLPLKPTEASALLDQIENDVFEMSNFNPSPNYYGYITGGGNQAAILAEVLKNGLNQNNLKWHSAPANSEMEKIVIHWICEFLGYPATGAGVLCSGGSVANFLNLAVMRKNMCPIDVANEGMYDAPKMCVYVSEQGHSSVDKAIDMLGLGKNYLRKIPVDADFKINCEILEHTISNDIEAGLLPVCIIGIAGTTNTGAVDPLRKLGEIAKQYNLWYMIDGAYGFPGAGTKLVGELFDGLELADSILVNPHKWFFVPFEVSAVIVKNKEHLRSTFSLVPDYLQGGKDQNEREDLMDLNLQLSKDFKALKVWMTFKAYGAEKLQWAIENDCLLARYAGDLIDQANDFERLAPIPLSIACFRYIGSGTFQESHLDQLNTKILQLIEEDGRIFFAGTRIHGKVALRINLTNHRRTKADIEFLLDVLRELGQKAEAVLDIK